MKKFIILVSCAGLLSSCATRAKVYQEPNPAKVIAATRAVKEQVAKVKEHVAKVKSTASQAKAKVVAAKDSEAKVVKLSGKVHEDLVKLKDAVPEPIKPAVDQIIEEHAAAEAEQTLLTDTIATAADLHVQLESQIKETETQELELEKRETYFEEQLTIYRADALKLASDASEERRLRVIDEKSLSWYRWHWWGSWIALGLGVLACVIVAILKFTGKLALKMPLLL